MRAYEIELIHKTDWTYKLLGTGAIIETIYAEVSCSRDGECVVIDLIMIPLGKPRVLSKVISALRSNKRVIWYKPVANIEHNILLLVSATCEESVRYMLNARKILVPQSRVNNGNEIYIILIRDKQELRNAAKDLESFSELISIRPVTIEKAMSNSVVLSKPKYPRLTKREKEILGSAIREGFFEYPKRVRVDDIARIHGVSKAYVSITIRRAIRKIIESMMDGELMN
jgi:predicted DNA binding protein